MKISLWSPSPITWIQIVLIHYLWYSYFINLLVLILVLKKVRSDKKWVSVILSIQMYLYGISWDFWFVHSVFIPNMIADHTITMLWSRIHGNEWRDQRLFSCSNTKSPNWSTFKLLIVFGENLLIEKKQEQKTIISILTYSYVRQWLQSFCHFFLKGWKVIFWGRGSIFHCFI